MKTIAVMTMAFLPATFIAALFAVPSLNWQSDTGNVIQGNHWVYWAFTLPATVLVFLIWYVLNRRHWIMQHIRKSARGRMDKNVQKSDIYGDGLV
jgi:Mg2+ and Co2+ transporter CorA